MSKTAEELARPGSSEYGQDHERAALPEMQAPESAGISLERPAGETMDPLDLTREFPPREANNVLKQPSAVGEFHRIQISLRPPSEMDVVRPIAGHADTRATSPSGGP